MATITKTVERYEFDGTLEDFISFKKSGADYTEEENKFFDAKKERDQKVLDAYTHRYIERGEINDEDRRKREESYYEARRVLDDKAIDILAQVLGESKTADILRAIVETKHDGYLAGMTAVHKAMDEQARLGVPSKVKEYTIAEFCKTYTAKLGEDGKVQVSPQGRAFPDDIKQYVDRHREAIIEYLSK